MNATQQKTVEKVKAEFFRIHSYGRPEEYEFKVVEVTEEPGGRSVMVYLVVGLKGDEGTMAEFFARSRGVYFVGRKGGIRASQKTTGRKGYRMVHGWRAMYVTRLALEVDSFSVYGHWPFSLKKP